MTNASERKIEESSSLSSCVSPTESLTDENNVISTTQDQAWKSRVLYCRKCDGHGKQVALKGHAPKCPYNLCECQSCYKLMTKRLHSFKKRNKSRLEAAAILTAQKKAQMAALELRRLSTDVVTQLDFGGDLGNIVNISQASTSNSPPEDYRANQMLNQESLSHEMETTTKPITVMSYEIWKEQCAARKNATLQTKRHSDGAIQQEIRKRSFEQLGKKDCSPKLKRLGVSPPSLLRPRSTTVDWSSSFVSNWPSQANDDHSCGAEYRRIILPTIPPMTVLVRRDGSSVASSLAPLHPNAATSGIPQFTTTSQNPLKSSETSEPNASVHASNPYVQNAIPCDDVRLSITNSNDCLGVHCASSSAIIHRPSPNVLNAEKLLKLPVNLVSTTTATSSSSSSTSTSASNTSPILTHSSATVPTISGTQIQQQSLASLSPQMSSSNNLCDSLAELFQNESLYHLFPSLLSPQNSGGSLVAQQQEQQQQVIQQLLSNTATINSLFGGTPIQQSTADLMIPSAKSTASLTNILPTLSSNSSTSSISNNTNELNLSMLFQLQEQQQRVGNTNLLASNGLLNIYQMLSDPITSQALQAQLKQLEHSGLLLGQSIAT